MARPYPWKCRSCGKQSLKPTVVNYSTEMEHDGRAYSFTVPTLEILECESCGERVLLDAAFERVLNQLRIEAELLTPAEIREKRKQVGLTQEQLANHLKVAKETVSRWETGGQIQQRGYDTLLRLFFDLADVRRYLMRRSGVKAAEPVRDALKANLAASAASQIGITFRTSSPERPLFLPAVESREAASASVSRGR